MGDLISGAVSVAGSILKTVGLISSSKPPSDDANRNARYRAAIADAFAQVISQVQDLNLPTSATNPTYDSNFQIKTRLTEAAARYASLPVYTDLEYADAVNVINGIVNLYNKKVAEIAAAQKQSSQNVIGGVLDAMGSLVNGTTTTTTPTGQPVTTQTNPMKNILLISGAGILLAILLYQLLRTFRR